MEDIIQKQLDEILSWTKKFREESVKSEDIVVFDVLCGDFNFDNISPSMSVQFLDISFYI